jgi:hypothetical protein
MTVRSMTGSLLTANATGTLALVLASAIAGCAQRIECRVAPLGNPDIVGLTADDVVRIMQRAGFTDDQIIEKGTDLRNALASTGAAQIQMGEKVEAILAVDGRLVFVSSRARGSFIYDVETGSTRGAALRGRPPE